MNPEHLYHDLCSATITLWYCRQCMAWDVEGYVITDHVEHTWHELPSWHGGPFDAIEDAGAEARIRVSMAIARIIAAASASR